MDGNNNTNRDRGLTAPILNSIIYIGSNLLSGLVGILIFPILTRLLPVEDIGRYDLFLYLSVTLIPLALLGVNLGIGAYITKIEKIGCGGLLKRLFKCVSLVLIVSTLLIVLLKVFTILHSVSFTLILLWFVSTLALSICYFLHAWYWWTKKAISASLIVNGIWVVGALLGVAFVFGGHASIESYILGLTLGFVLFCIIAVLFSLKGEKKTEVSSELFKEILRVSWPLGVMETLFLFSMGFEKTMLLGILGPFQLGIYAVVSKVASIPKFIGQNMLYAWLPEIMQGSRVGKREILFAIISVYSIIALLVIYLLRRPLIMLIGGKEYVSAVNLLVYAAGLNLMDLFPSIIATKFLEKKETRPMLVYSLCVIFFVFFVGRQLVPGLGIIGAMHAAFLGKAVGMLLLVIISKLM